MTPTSLPGIHLAALFPWLAVFGGTGLLVVAVALVARGLSRSASGRTQIGRAMAAALVALPVLIALAFTGHVPATPVTWHGSSLAIPAAWQGHSVDPASERGPTSERPAGPLVAREKDDPGHAAAASPDPSDGDAAFSGAGAGARSRSRSGRGLAGAAVLVWLVGLAAGIGRLSFGLLALRRHGRAAAVVATDHPASPGVRVRRGGPFAVPVCFGIRRPTILLPVDAAGWTRERTDIVLRHEMAHVERRDALHILLVRVATAVHWFNPLAWICQGCFERDVEDVCDELVLRDGVPGWKYARALVASARDVRRVRPPAGIPAAVARTAGLERRIERILAGPPAPPGRVAGLAGAAAVLLVAVGAVAGAAPSTAAPPPTPGSPTAGPPPQAASVAGGDPAELCEQDRWASDAQADSAATRRLIVQLGSADGKRRAEAAAGLGNVGTPAAVPALVAALADPNEHVRQFAASALGNLGDPRAAAPLRGALADPDEHVQQAAAGALGDLADPSAVPDLVALLEHPDKHLRQAAAAALGRLGDARAVGPLTDRLADAEPHVRAGALRALGDLGARETAAAVARRFEAASDPFERLEAARALGRFGDFRGVEAIAAMLKDHSEQFLRRDAAWALGAIAGTSDDAGRSRPPLGEAAAGVEAALRAATRDESLYVQYAAACSLGRAGDEASEPALRRLIEDADTGAATREAATWALARIEGRAAAGS